MRQKLFIFLTLIGLLVILIGLNAATYVQKQEIPDNEVRPNRSSYNPGSTGTRALYSLLSETGRKVVRWQEPPGALRANNKNKPAVFVVIGQLKREFIEEEAVDLYQWVYDGGRLVIVDREPADRLARPIGQWQVYFSVADDKSVRAVDPADQNQITKDVAASKPVQPSPFTAQVNAVQTSRFSSFLGFDRTAPSTGSGTGFGSGPAGSTPPPPPPAAAPPPPAANYDQRNSTSSNRSNDLTPTQGPYTTRGPVNTSSNRNTGSQKYTTAARANTSSGNNGTGTESDKITIQAGDYYTGPPASADDETGLDYDDGNAPAIHIANGNQSIVAEARYGAGRVIYISDPYIFSNAGIALVDNSRLALNILGVQDGIVAFDEYHQGFGGNNNRMFQYFAGTPVIAIFLQALILTGLVLFSQSRRFARPVPEPEPDRLSKLEYVSAMAELQERTRAFDLAIENIYNDFRRRAARLLGVDNYSVTRREMAVQIAERAKLDPNDVEDVMFQCEDIIHGEPTDKKEVVALIGRLRGIEEKLGMRRVGRTRI